MRTKVKTSASHADRRRMIVGTIVGGAAVLAAAPGASASTLLTQWTSAEAGQWLAWDDGYHYPIAGLDQSGQWVTVEQQPGGGSIEFLVDPVGWIIDGVVWYPISDVDDEGIWYDDGEGFEWLLPY